MNKRSIILFACIFAVFSSVFSTTVAATPFNLDPETFSYSKVLPVVAGGTLVIEALTIMFFSKIRRIVNVSFAVLVANVVSFLAIRLLIGLFQHKAFYTGMLMNGNNSTSWLIFALCFIVSLLLEIPIIWLSLRPFTPKKQRLIWSAVIANTISFIATAAFDLLLHHFLFK